MTNTRCIWQVKIVALWVAAQACDQEYHPWGSRKVLAGRGVQATAGKPGGSAKLIPLSPDHIATMTQGLFIHYLGSGNNLHDFAGDHRLPDLVIGQGKVF